MSDQSEHGHPFVLDDAGAIEPATAEHWYRRRIVALERLLACWQAGVPPTEKLHRELAETRRHVDHEGRFTP